MVTFLWTLLGALLSIILYPIIIPFIETPLHLRLIKLLSRKRQNSLRKKTSLQGNWVQKWITSNSQNFSDENEGDVQLYQIGKQVYGSIQHEKSNFSISGTIDKDMYLTGVWEDLTDGNNYKGAFQLYIFKYGTHMAGKWVGYSETNNINTGDWVWKRHEQSDYKPLTARS